MALPGIRSCRRCFYVKGLSTEALGFETATIRSLEDLEQAAAMLRNPDGPILLDCKINGSIPVGWLYD